MTLAESTTEDNADRVGSRFMTDAGFGPETFWQNVICRMATPDEASRLTLPGGTPIVAVTRYAYSKAGQCVEVDQMVLDSGAYALEYAVTA